MKIYSMEVQTDLGRRVVQIAAPIDVDPSGEMPPVFRSLTEMLWEAICKVSAQSAELAARAPKAEA
jgi:hypothetical protein